MLPIHEITKSLPPPRDDEPPSLRQDIVDEILDHLQCGLRRELLVNGGDEAIAKKRVLNNFGDPQQVAKRLWFQAMWSKIMTQRLVVGSSIFSMVVSASLVLLVGWMVQQMQTQQREQQQVNAALIEQMTKLLPQSNQPPAGRDQHWNNLKVQVTKGRHDGPVAEGFKIVVEKLPAIGDVQNGAAFETVIDLSGFADCGYVEPGRYKVTVLTPWNELTEVEFTVHPGQDHVEQIVTPEKMPDLAEVTFRVEGIPDAPATKDAVLAIWFQADGSRNFNGRKWQVLDGLVAGSSAPLLLVNFDGQVWIAPEPPDTRPAGSTGYMSELPWISRAAELAEWKKLNSSDVQKLPAGSYTVLYAISKAVTNLPPDDPQWRAHLGNLKYAFYELGHSTNISVETGKLNECTLTIPEEISKRISEPRLQQGGGNF